ncbi:protein of unknown function [Methylocaldum szegediense]|uniref:Uncharacterized protein n=1 Tax=Methylocaldum szegediense TaxID=73780 RepID=A0ABM9I546_9GAMM|nr:protein of unknown function [Methylocaldum szegediense]
MGYAEPAPSGAEGLTRPTIHVHLNAEWNNQA